MSRLFLKVFLFLGIPLACITLIIACFPMHYASPEYPMWKSKIDFIKDKQRADIIIVGDSRAVAGFRPELIHRNAMNLALGGSTPMDSYFLLKRLLGYHEPKTVIISFAPLHLVYADSYLDRTLKYGLLSPSELNEISALAVEQQERFWLPPKGRDGHKAVTPFDSLPHFASYFSFFSFYTPEIRNGLLSYLKPPGRHAKNVQVLEEIKARQGNMDFGTAAYSSDLNDEARLERFEPSRVLDRYFVKLLELCEEHRIEVFYIAAPINQSSADYIRERFPEFIEGYEGYLQSKAAAFPEFHWHYALNARADNEFGDPSHLNAQGQAVFSREVAALLGE